MASDLSSKSEEEDRCTEHQMIAWAKTIDVQQHFNDIAMRVRNLFVTLVAALFAIIGYGTRSSGGAVQPPLSGVVLQFVPVIAAIGMFACVAFWFLDRLWYHRLLIGAVIQGELLEGLLLEKVPGIGLTKAVSHESRPAFFGFKLSATLRLDVFYISFGAALYTLWQYVSAASLCANLIGILAFSTLYILAIVVSTKRKDI